MKPVVSFVIAALVFGVVGCGADGEPTGGPGKRELGTAPANATDANGNKTADARPKTSTAPKASKPPADPGPYAPAEPGDRYDPSASDGKVQGDGSIQRFGDAASTDEARAAVAAAVGFYDARAQGDWARACGLMTSGIQKQLIRTFGRSARAEDRGCPEILAALAGGLPRQLRVEQARTVRFTGLRAEGERGFALFTSDSIPHGFVPMARQDGQWRVAALSGSAL
jgi:hypothetical protein